MSADNWGTCPKCKHDAEKKRATIVDKAKASYGQVPEEEYRAMLAKANQATEPKLEETTTLREDYEIWTDENGKFLVVYGCSCDTCDFEFKFRHEEKLKF